MPQAQTVQMPHRWPLVSKFYTRSPDIPIVKDSRLVNGYVELDPEDNEYWIYKRLGISSTVVYPGLGYPGGLYYYSNNSFRPQYPVSGIVSVTGPTISFNGFSAGTLPGGGGLACWFATINYALGPQVVIMNTQDTVVFNPATQAVIPITDPNFPTNLVPGLAYLNQYLYVMDSSGSIWGTLNLDNPFLWDPLNQIKASTQADQGVALFTQLTYVVAFKQWTTQIFYDAGNATGSPLGPVPEAQIPFGCLDARSIQKIDERLLWVTSNQTISPQVILMENLAPRIVSTPSVERLLDNISGGGYGNNVVPPMLSWSTKHGGHTFYGLTFPYENITLVYDLSQDFWSIWTDPYGNYWPGINFSYTAPNYNIPGSHLIQLYPKAGGGFNFTSGVYQIDGDYEFPTDCGVLYPVDIYTPNFTGKTTRRKTLNMMYFCADQTPGSILQARYSDDDYKTWSNFRSIDLNRERPNIDHEGTFTKRAYHFRHRCNTRFRIKSSDLQIDIGTL